ncbi:MAG: hypothetical protein A2076_10075 [Geobacteraceae bacterium GWC2_53_11]|nr:MAG: hypothetical protein A2076_10075 [Geobacteraceae bacterium GWC2_53_11]
MIYHRFVAVLCVVLLHMFSIVSAHALELQHQSAQLKAGGYFPASKAFDPGTGIDLVYSVKPVPYAVVDAAIGYYRAEQGASGFLSALPLTISARAILPLPMIDVFAGGGAGVYYKMAGGLTEMPADHSEFSLGYHANAGIEVPTSNGLSLLLDCKYVFVNQGKFSSYDIKHGGAFVYGGFSLNY